ncbi:hypothetical protein OKW50_001192 [Paraburkholderia youngii]
MRPFAISTLLAPIAFDTSASDSLYAARRAGSTATSNSSSAPPVTSTRATPSTDDSSGRIWNCARSRSADSDCCFDVRLYASTGNTVGSMRRTCIVVPGGSVARISLIAD